jgi:hypothetical protein
MLPRLIVVKLNRREPGLRTIGETGSPKIRKQARAITIANNQSAKSIPCKEHRRCLRRPVEIDSMIERSSVEIQINGCAVNCGFWIKNEIRDR